ncbi:peroxisomal ATPase PEX6 [Lampris incognitus]|uniref:peroxisomal ATPase PEX6 n=1 Tax=Lampris incognitus TaxID=2546036 RepID=UPI0024B57222|nr:peroxisomal ATPase PEX6 [Lampris incognitus]
MAEQVELSRLDKFPTHLSPLDVLISRSRFNSVFQNHTENTSTLIFTPQRHHGPGKPGLLVCVHRMEEEEEEEDSNKPLKLFTSVFFLQHYGLQNRSRGSVRSLEPVSLTRVVLGARSRGCFKWASSDRFSAGLLLLASCPGRRLLVREGDPLLLPHQGAPPAEDVAQGVGRGQDVDLEVLECSPVIQGVITANTAVVVTDSSGSMDRTVAATSSSSKAVTELFFSDFAHYAGGLGGAGSLLAHSRLLGSGFSGFLQALECRLEVRVVQCPGVRDVDRDSAVFVSRQLLLRLGMFDREWVVLSGDGPAATPRGQTNGWRKVHLAAVVVSDFKHSTEPEVQDDVGFISGTHWFNLTQGEAVPVGTRTLRIKRWKQTSPQAGARLSESFCRLASPPFARELHIEPVVSPEYSAHVCCDALLCAHFTLPRLVTLGDVLTIPAEAHPEMLESSSEGANRWPVRYFRVKKVCGSAEREEEDGGGSYLADRLHTSLYTAGSSNSPVPYCSAGDGGSLWDSLSPPGLKNTVDQVVAIILPYINHSCAALSSCTVLIQGPRGSGKVTAVRAASRRLHLHLFKVDCVSVCADTAAACEAKLKSVFQRAEAHQPCVLLLRNLQLLCQPREGAEEDARILASLCQLLSSTPSSVVVVATVSRPRDLPAGIMAGFVHQVSVQSPSEEDRRAMLVGLSRDLPLGRDVSLELLAKHTAGFLLGDLGALLVEAGRTARRRLLQTCSVQGPGDPAQLEVVLRSSGVTIRAQDFTAALDNLQNAYAQNIGAPKIPSVRWQDVGGLQEVKKEILDTVQLPLERPELLTLGLHRAGLLLYGPPGTGKTLLAKAVATECSMTFLSVKGPELINMYIGQSEQNIREVFSKARAAAPCVIFFDELDSLAPSRGRSGDSGGVMDRVVSQLGAEMDALQLSGGVFVIGATNRPDLLDQSLLRPGRFDKLVYVGINTDRSSQLQVLKAITRKFHLDPGVSLQEVVERCPPQLTGADLYALCSDAMMAAITRKIALITRGLETEESPLLLSAEDFTSALENLQPSVSDGELLRYQHIQQTLAAK